MKPYYKKVYSLKPLQSELREHLGIDWMMEDEDAPSGPIQLSYTGILGDPIPKSWIESFKGLGYHMTENPFSGKPMGAFSSLASINLDTKERSYAATAYYAPVADRKNLHLLTGLSVDKILTKKHQSKLCAGGAQFQTNGDVVTVKARKEVILAAGSFQSPKILEISDIGAAELLRSHKIDINIDNPYVGENLQDHFVCGIGFEAEDHVTTLDDLIRQDPKAIEAAMAEYVHSKTGLLTSVGLASYAYLPVVDLLSEDGQSMLRKLLVGCAACNNESANPAADLYHNIAKSILESKDEASGSFLAVAAQTVPPADPDYKDCPIGPVPGKFITLGAMLSQPLSRGSVHIKSSDPNEKPVIDPRFLAHPLDIEVLARHMQYLEVIAETHPFRKLLKEGGRHSDPRSYLENLEAAKEYIRKSGISMWHPTSTCSMLPRDKGGVVDEKLVVYGSSNLRIVDASIIPLIPRANVQSTVYAVAERAAGLIKAEHGLVGA